MNRYWSLNLRDTVCENVASCDHYRQIGVPEYHKTGAYQAGVAIVIKGQEGH
jgi:hypothetical protein